MSDFDVPHDEMPDSLLPIQRPASQRERDLDALLSGEAGYPTVVLGPVAAVLAALARRGILGGLDLSERYPELGHAILVCATETKLGADIDAYAAALGDAMSASRAAA